MVDSVRIALVAALSAASVAATVLLGRDARAYCRTTTNTKFVPTTTKPCDDVGTKLFWSGRCTGFSVQENASGQVPLATARALVAESFAQWTNADCTPCGVAGKPSIAVSDLGPITCGNVEHTQGGTNANIVIFRDGAWPHEGAALALTTVTYKVDGGEIYDVDVEVQSNPAEVKLTTAETVPAGEYDLRSILVHEMGHFLGLAHTARANSDATMYESYKPGEFFMRSLSQDDVCGVCAIYPPTRTATCDATPRGGLGDECGGGSKSEGCGCDLAGAASGYGALPAALVALGWWSRRARSIRRR